MSDHEVALEGMMRKPIALVLGLGLGWVAAGCSDSNLPAPTPEMIEAAIESSINRLPEEDRGPAKRQKFCPIMMQERLGGRDTPIKVMIGERPVFVCCDGCVALALKSPEKTLEQLDQLQKATP